MGDIVGCDIAAGARPVLHNHRLAPDLLQAITDEARGDVGRAARRERHNHAHRLDRPLRGPRARRKQGWRRQSERGEAEKTAAVWHQRTPPDKDRLIASGHLFWRV